MGAYRFFNNDALTLPQLHAMATSSLQQLVPVGTRAYVAHDFSVVDYSKHTDKTDVVQVGNECGRGYDLYAALVLDVFGRPLGPLVTELRNAEGCLSSESKRPIPFVDHLGQAERGVVAAERLLFGREIVHLFDREFDDVALQRLLVGKHGKYVMRAQHLSRIVQSNGRDVKLAELVKALPRLAAGEVERDGKRFERFVAEMYVTFTRPSLRGRKRGEKPVKGPPIEVRVVVTELRGIGCRDHYEWVLLTNLEDSTEAVVAAYLARWRIERFFYLTKVGLRLEHWRQETGAAIARRLAVTMLAAMAMYQLLAAKEDPSIRAIATLGGWLGRKRDHLGPVVMMRGVLILISTLSAVAQHGVDRLLQMAHDAGLGFAIPAALRERASQAGLAAGDV